MTQAALAAKLMQMKEMMLCGNVAVKKVDVRSMQITGGKVKIPNGFSSGAKPLTTAMTAMELANRREGRNTYTCSCSLSIKQT